MNTVIAISGPIDVVADANKAYLIRNGHPMMSRVTGTGCMLSSAVGVFAAANPDNLLEATAVCISAYGYAGELAYEKVQSTNGGTGSFRMFLMDAMSNMDNETFCRVPKLRKCKKERSEFVERMEAKMKAEDLMVYAITDRYWLNGAKLADQVEDVLKNGATFLQLREKSFKHEEMVARQRKLKLLQPNIKCLLSLTMIFMQQKRLMQMVFILDKATWSIARRVKFWERIRLLVCRQEIYRKR